MTNVLQGRRSNFLIHALQKCHSRLSSSVRAAAAITFFLGVSLLPQCAGRRTAKNLLLHHEGNLGKFLTTHLTQASTAGRTAPAHLAIPREAPCDRTFQQEVHSELLNTLVPILPCKHKTLEILLFRHHFPSTPSSTCLMDVNSLSQSCPPA